MNIKFESPTSLRPNLLIYSTQGKILAGLTLREESNYVNPRMIYRYCDTIFEFPDQPQIQWGLFRINPDESVGTELCREDYNVVSIGRYMVLDHNRNQIHVRLTSESAPRRVYSGSPTSSQSYIGRNNLQGHFRDGLRDRDGKCVISGEIDSFDDDPYLGLEAVHIYPVSKVVEWNGQQCRQRWITDTTPANQIGLSGLYSLQNGLLLECGLHKKWDSFGIGVDPDEDFKIIYFGADSRKIGGRYLQRSAVDGVDPNHRVSPGLLRWHLRMCILRFMKGNGGFQPWDQDLGPNDVGKILSQPDAAERMEEELFTRLGSLIA
ncbi:hypothetical protein F5884DRAFT_319047 [Xylogone sp. PMI_703]|nr:hypothetical protein F5884DRAFT_319047 [Xylogone sp. PMI_703]